MTPRHITVAAFTLLAAGCQAIGMPTLPSLSAYRIDIQQGNFVTQDMIAKLQPGMSRAQVRFALGTPLVMDPFHADRWDYVYRYEKGGKLIEHRRIFVVFSEDKLLRIDGDVKPSVASTSGKPAVVPSVAPAAPVPEKPSASPATPAAPSDPTVNSPPP
jgi:outer membrane protein assembly factor BamE